MPLPYDFFVKATTIVSAASDANDGKDPLGCALSGATFDLTGNGSGELALIGTGTEFTNVRDNDVIYLTDTGSGVDDGLYLIKTKVSTSVVLLFPDTGLTGDSLAGIASSDGPWLTIQYGFDNLPAVALGQRLVICADGGGTDDAWEPTGTAIELGAVDYSSQKPGFVAGGNARGIVDGTVAVIDGSNMDALESIFEHIVANGNLIELHFSDLRLTGALGAGMTLAPTSSNIFDCSWKRVEIDNCTDSGVELTKANNAGVFLDCHIHDNGGFGYGTLDNFGNNGGGTMIRCRIHDNTSGGLRANQGLELTNCLIYDNGGPGVTFRAGAAGANPSTFQGCVLHGNVGSGVYHESTSNFGIVRTIENTVFSNNGGYGYEAGSNGFSIIEFDTCLFHSNTSGMSTLAPVYGAQRAWDDTNLWIEFTTGDYDDTGHADGDFRLEKTGAFANLAYRTTGLVNLTASGNMTAGLYNIASKISDDAVLLTKSAGSDTTGAVTADNDPGFASEVDGLENFRPVIGALVTKLGLEVEVR